jgi:hypothetical protein
MPYIDIDIDIDEFLNSCRDRDIQEIIKYLTETGWLNSPQPESPSIDSVWYDALTKIRDRGQIQLSNEEEALIMSIANRIV